MLSRKDEGGSWYFGGQKMDSQVGSLGKVEERITRIGPPAFYFHCLTLVEHSCRLADFGYWVLRPTDQAKAVWNPSGLLAQS